MNEEPKLSDAEQRFYLEHRNVIPPIVHPDGKYWQQPPIMAIEIDDSHALVPRHIFDALLEYSLTIPTGAYEGKVWKRERFLVEHGRHKHTGEWFLCWYGVCEIPGEVSINSRRILIP